MMNQPSLRTPSTLQPRPRAVPTLSSTSIAAKPTSTPSPASRPSSRSRQSSPSRSIGPSDVSDKATAALIRRVLCPPQSHPEPRPVNELLPPLTSSNDVDLQLYAIIAIVVKDLVYSWYGKITPDQGFVEEVVRIVAHCTRALESRLRTVDLESLVLDEIPELIEGHIQGGQAQAQARSAGALANRATAFRVSRQSHHLSPLLTDPRVIYHNLIPHPALSPVPNPAVPSTTTEQHEHEAEYRQLLVQGALAVLLPTEDLENACLRTLVADVIADSILGNSIGGKVCEGWFIWGGITKLVDVVKARIEPKATGEAIEVDTRSRLEKFGLLSEKGESKEASKDDRRSTFSSMFWRILQYGFLTVVTIRFFIIGFITASSRPMRSTWTSKTSGSSEPWPIDERSEPPRPMLSFKILSVMPVLFDLRSRMPWVSGSLALLQHQLIHGPLGLAATDGILDQYMHHTIHTQFQPSQLLPTLFRTLRQILFPNSSLPPPAPPPPCPSEVSDIRRTCALSLLSLLPAAVCKRFFGAEEKEDWVGEVEGELDAWGDEYLNKHLGYAILELIVIRVLPELGEQRVEELLKERLGNDV